MNLPNHSHHIQVLQTQFRELYHAHQYEHALEIAQQIIALRPNHADALGNAASAAHRAQRVDLAIEYATRALAANPQHLNSCDCLSYAFYLQNDWAQSARYGLKALQLRDAQIPVSPHFRLPEPPKRENGQQIIAFSLFGDSPKYVQGAIMNALVSPQIYPDWQCRFYVNHSVPESAKHKLRELGAQIFEIDEESGKWVGTVWRFLVLEDKTVSRVIFRDTDSIISLREAAAVREWVQSGKRFHTIRDSGSHTELILAGLWGAAGGAIDDIRGKLRDYFRQPLKSVHFADQFFLCEKIWGYVRQDVLAHDRLFGFMNPLPLPSVPEYFNLNQHHIGSCQMVDMSVACPFPEGTMMTFRAKSRILPAYNADFQWFRLPETALLSEYELPVYQGNIQIWLPRAFHEGLANQDTEIQISTRTPPIQSDKK